MVREYCRIARHFNAVLVKKGDINLFGFDSRWATQKLTLVFFYFIYYNTTINSPAAVIRAAFSGVLQHVRKILQGKCQQTDGDCRYGLRL